MTILTPISKSRLTLPTAEIFFSIEGEGPLTGYPTLFIRSFGCNFTCQGFSNPEGSLPEVPVVDSILKYKPEVGCDSAYAWHPNFKHLAHKHSPHDLWLHVVRQLPHYALELLTESTVPKESTTGYFLPKSFPALSITGGEPLLHQKFWTEFFTLPEVLKNVRKLIIETNSSVPPHPDFMKVMRNLEAQGCLIVWANSPKLANSGEEKSRAIRPSIVLQQQRLASPVQYFKFVSDGSLASLDEIRATVEEYNHYLLLQGGEVIRDEQVYLMPEGALREQQEAIQRKVADACLVNGYSFCARVHCWVYSNEVGT